MAMTFIKMIYSVWCTGLLASQLARVGKWHNAAKLISK